MAFSQRPHNHHQRGSISVLSVLWLAFTLLGVTAITHATAVVQQRAFVQEAADSIALAAVINGRSSAHQLEQMLRVNVIRLELINNDVTVEVSAFGFTATSSAAVSRSTHS